MTLRMKFSLAGMASNAPSLSLHVYRVGGVWDDDDKIIRAGDKKIPRYYLKGTRLATGWGFALHVGGESTGALICRVKSPYLGPLMMGIDPGPISVALTTPVCSTMGTERRVVYMYRMEGSFWASSGTYAFRGPDEEEYRWRPARSRVWGSGMECLNAYDEVVATYRIILFALSKDGELRIHQSVQSMTELIVATCLAMRTPDY